MNNWHPIDLHIHTVCGITRDKKTDNVNFSYTLFQNVISKYKYGLMAVTNHNIIDLQNYILMKYLFKKIIRIYCWRIVMFYGDFFFLVYYLYLFISRV